MVFLFKVCARSVEFALLLHPTWSLAEINAVPSTENALVHPPTSQLLVMRRTPASPASPASRPPAQSSEPTVFRGKHVNKPEDLDPEKDRVIIAVGEVSVGKSSAVLAKLLQHKLGHLDDDGAPLDAPSLVRQARSVFLGRQNDELTGPRGIAIGPDAGSTTTLGWHLLSRTPDGGRRYLVDTPGLGLTVSYPHPDGEHEQNVIVDGKAVSGLVTNSLATIDAAVLVINQANDAAFELYVRLLAGIREKYNLRPGSEEWHSAWCRIFILRTRADECCEAQERSLGHPQTWTRNRIQGDVLQRLNANLCNITALFCDRINASEQSLAQKGCFKHRPIDPVCMAGQVLPACTASMRFLAGDYADEDDFVAAHCCRDFGIPEALNAVHSQLDDQHELIRQVGHCCWSCPHN